MEMTQLSKENLIASWLKEYGGDKVSAASFLCDRHARIPEKTALFYEDGDGRMSKFTYAELMTLSSKMAGFLRRIGVEKGGRVACFLPKSPELVITALAVWRLGAAYVPLFTAFGPDAVDYRVSDSGARVVVTNPVHRPKLSKTTALKDGEMTVVTVADLNGKGIEKCDYSFWHELENAAPVTESVSVDGNDTMIMLYTSGTTGNPKGVQVPVRALAAFQAYMAFGVDIRQEDMYWNMADPGWAYGLYYNVVGPLLLGKAILFYSGAFTPENIFRILSKYQVTNFASAPTAYRALKSANMVKPYPLKLRVASSAGEPLNPGVVEWAEKQWGIPIHDHFGQTELGMAVNNHHHQDVKKPIKTGSMGISMPGFRMVVVDLDGNELGAGREGMLAVDVENSPLFWFRGYWNAEEKTKEKFIGNGRYCTAGDTVSIDGDGCFYFSGRSDDIILCAGYRIGPFEVESALLRHPDVAEAAVVGKPDELRGETIKAFVSLKPSAVASEELADELKVFVKKHLAAHQYPREVEFVDQLPKTPSGKIQRFLLREEA